MSVKVILGNQAGDEGKGRLVDAMAPNAKAIVRFQGGNNAGHTIVVGDTTYKFHLIPSGILHKDVICCLGNGIVLDPDMLGKELDSLDKNGLDHSNLKISPNAHLIMPYHIALDHSEEDARSAKDSIGTTRKGIGPTYADKASRIGIRVQDALDKEYLRKRVATGLAPKQHLLDGKDFSHLDFLPALDVDSITEFVYDKVQRLKPYVTDISELLLNMIENGDEIICEGAQGVELDIDHGAYPFVTSSNCNAAAACTGAGIPMNSITEIWGVAKAFPTRVDTVGAFPTKMGVGSEMDELLITRGREFGTTTGRRRRAGWMDLVALKRNVRLNGITNITITKLDVMHDLDHFKFAVAYKNKDGEVLDYYPYNYEELDSVEPVYETIPGFKGQIDHMRTWDELPEEAKNFARKVSSFVGVPVSFIGVGPEREQIIPVPAEEL